MSKMGVRGEAGHRSRTAMRLLSSSVGVVAGLAGLEHGIFEILQGNAATNGMVIDAIGPLQRMWENGSEPAFTLIPNFLITGILATLLSLLVMIWAAAFIERKHGTLVLLVLSTAMFLFGGGFAPPIFAIVALIASASIDKPLSPWRRLLPNWLQGVLVSVWKPGVILFVSLSTLCIVIAIFGHPLLWFTDADGALSILDIGSKITFFGLGPLVMLAAVAYDIRRQEP